MSNDIFYFKTVIIDGPKNKKFIKDKLIAASIRRQAKNQTAPKTEIYIHEKVKEPFKSDVSLIQRHS